MTNGRSESLTNIIGRTSGKVVYQGRDLEAMSFAVNYHRWILQIFAPYLGKRVVEVGAGTGSFSEMILTYPLESLSLVEPSEGMFSILTQQIAALNTVTNVTLYNSVFRQVAEKIKAAQQPDSIIYVNVLEHIADDEAELRAMHATLAPHGRVFIFVPALRWLFSRFDQNIGHFRRYTKPELEEKCRRADFKIVKSSYFDALGIAPWLLKYRLLKSEKMEPQAVRAYDQYIVPGMKRVETLISPPLGKNVLLIAEKI